MAKRQLLPCTESHLALQKLFFQISGNCFSFSMLLLATKLSVVIQWLSLQSCAFELYGPPESHAILYPGLQKNSKTLAFLTSHSIPHVGLIYPVPLCNGDSNFYPPFFLWRCQSMPTCILAPSPSENSESILLSLANPSTCVLDCTLSCLFTAIASILQLCPLQHSQGSSTKAKLPPFIFPPLPC